MSRTAILAAILPLLTLGGCESDTTHQNADKEVIALERSALDKWAQSNTDGYLEIAAEDVTWFDFTEGEQLRREGRLLVHERDKYGWANAVFEPARMSAEELERGVQET